MNDVPTAPAPWTLRGRAYASVLRCPNDLLDTRSFAADSLAGKRARAPFGTLMFVDYAESDVGPYHELLFIPGAFRFADGRQHPSISRIFVSSEASVVNGQRNWGIPKGRADFDVRYEKNATNVKVALHGREFADLRFRHFPIGLPVLGALIPKGQRTLGQHFGGKTFLYAPETDTMVLAAKLERARFDPAVFPDVSACPQVATVHLPRFRMKFPVATVIDRL